jgi:hypothetical protein
MRWVAVLLAIAWLPCRADEGDLTAAQAREIIARDNDEPAFPYDGSLANPLAAVGGTAEDLARLEAEAARWIPFMGRESAIFTVLTAAADPRLQRLADRFQGVVSLPEVRRLTAEAAGELAGRVECLILPALEELSPETAAALAAQVDLRIRLPRDASPDALEPLTQGCRLTLMGVDDPTPEMLAVVAKAAGGIALPDVVTLGPAAARVLATENTCVDLPGIKHLPLDVATALGGGRPDLCLILNGVEEMSPEVAAALRQQWKGVLHVRGLKRLSAAAAKPLVGIPGDLYLDSLESLDAETAAVLARHPSGIYMPGLRQLDAEVVGSLAAHRWFLSLDSRDPLSPAAATALCERRGRTTLTVPALDLAAARILADGVNRFELDLGFATPPPGDVVDVLVANRRIHFSHDRLTTLSVAAATALARHKGIPLSFDALADVSPELAAALATDNKDSLALNGLKTLAPEVARELARHQRDLQLLGIESLDREAAMLIAEHRGPLQLGLKRLTPDIAHGLARLRGGLQCDQIESLDPRAAAALAGGPEWLAFNGLREIDLETARALAAHDGTVSLTGLESLPPAVAEPLLADRPPPAAGRQPELAVNFGLLTGLTPRIAEALVQRGARNSEEFDLVGIERLDSTEAAQAIAKTQHRIALLGLRQVTPAALTALKTNPLIEIPDIDSLELLPDVGGSADDFVVP